MPGKYVMAKLAPSEWTLRHMQANGIDLGCCVNLVQARKSALPAGYYRR